MAVGILRAVGREGRNSHLSHYHETSGLAQTRDHEVSVKIQTTYVLMLNPSTATPKQSPTVAQQWLPSKFKVMEDMVGRFERIVDTQIFRHDVGHKEASHS